MRCCYVGGKVVACEQRKQRSKQATHDDPNDARTNTSVRARMGGHNEKLMVRIFKMVRCINKYISTLFLSLFFVSSTTGRYSHRRRIKAERWRSKFVGKPFQTRITLAILYHLLPARRVPGKQLPFPETGKHHATRNEMFSSIVAILQINDIYN